MSSGRTRKQISHIIMPATSRVWVPARADCSSFPYGIPFSLFPLSVWVWSMLLPFCSAHLFPWESSLLSTASPPPFQASIILHSSCTISAPYFQPHGIRRPWSMLYLVLSIYIYAPQFVSSLKTKTKIFLFHLIRHICITYQGKFKFWHSCFFFFLIFIQHSPFPSFCSVLSPRYVQFPSQITRDDASVPQGRWGTGILSSQPASFPSLYALPR